jgi:hypothetical protein
VIQAAVHGGKACPSTEEPVACATHPCPVDCIFEWLPWTLCSVSCGGGAQHRKLSVSQLALYNGKECPSEIARVCNTQVCPTPSPTTAPTKAPTPTPATTPIIHINNGDIITIEASPTPYSDGGAICEDEYDGKLDVTASGSVNSNTPGAYTITYSCVNHRGYGSRPATRRVIVRDNTCPVCHIVRGSGDAATAEAEFAYADQGAYFTDSVDGKITKNIQVVGSVNTAKVGTYYLTYRVQDSAGNWNDGQCKGPNTCRRKVNVVDTLKPVIALKYGGKNFHVSQANDVSKSDTPHSNPAAKYFNFMAETASSTNAFVMLGVAGLAVAGIVLASFAASKREESTEVPV